MVKRIPISAFLLYVFCVLLNLSWLILGDKLSLWHQVAIVPVTVMLAGAGVLIQTNGLRPFDRQRCLRTALWFLLGYYLCVLSVLLFFGGLFHVDRGYGGTVNTIPFHTIQNYIRYYLRTGSFVSISNLVGNVVILLPMGVILPVMFRPMRRFWIFIPFAACLAVGVEVVQYLTATGAADVDDSILNFAGAVLGYLCTRAVQVIGTRMRSGRGKREGR